MRLIKTKALYQEACRASVDVHEITEKERSLLQSHLLKMYKEIEAVCINHNLTVMLAYGSVLGAARHGGFIPWDDDMDLLMPRDDYELLINKYAEELPNYLKIYAPNSRNKAIARFAKVVDIRTKFIEAYADDDNDDSQGVFVDIFPLDSINDKLLNNKIKRCISMALMYVGTSVGFYEQKSTSYKRLMNHSIDSRINYWIRYCLGFICSFLSFQKWMDIIDEFCQSKSNTGYVSELLGDYTWRHIPEGVFYPPTRGLFEDVEVFLPRDPIKYLELTYTDWQRIPSIEEREQHFVRKMRLC